MGQLQAEQNETHLRRPEPREHDLVSQFKHAHLTPGRLTPGRLTPGQLTPRAFDPRSFDPRFMNFE
jgi:hypothetical protein